MSYKALTQFIPAIEEGKDVSGQLRMELYELVEEQDDMELHTYGDILTRKGFDTFQAMAAADVSSLDADCILAMMLSAARCDELGDGNYCYSYLRDSGALVKWLKRLEEFEG